jgi:hypothetical protein
MVHFREKRTMRQWFLISTLCWLAATVPVAKSEAAEGAAAGAQCAAIDGLDQVVSRGAVLVLGELHGSQESPAFVGEVVCHAAAAKMSVTLALELLDSEKPGIDAYLSSGRSDANREQLIGAGTWSNDYQDGRTSQAMLSLIDRVGSLRDGGAAVTIELFDRRGWSSSQERDRLMAEALAGVVDSTASDVVIVLTGNIHSRVSRGTPWIKDYEPMTYLAATQIDRNLVTLDVAHAGGTAWICNGSEPSSCGVKGVGGRSEENALMIELGADPAVTGHYGWYHVGPLSASRPAAGS